MESQIQRLHEAAVDAAVSGKWDQAIDYNHQVLALDPNNLDTHLALGFAYLQTNQFDESAKHYRKALSIEPGNVIAKNNLDKLAVLKKKNSPDSYDKNESDDAPRLKEFINVVGKTKIVELVNIGQSEVLANLKVGQHIELKTKKRRIEVRTLDGDYIGALPDDISKRLLFFIEASSTYNVYVKSALKNQVEIFLQEDKKGPKVNHFISFPKNIQDDLKSMMQSLNKDEDDEDKIDENKGDDDYDDDKTEQPQEEDTDGLTDLDQLAADIDDEPHDTFITDLSAYDEGDDESEE